MLKNHNLFISSVAVGFAFLVWTGSVFGHPLDGKSTPHFDTTQVEQGDYVCEAACVTHVIQAPSLFRYAAVEIPLGSAVDIRFFDDSAWLDWARVVPEDDRPDGIQSISGSSLYVMHSARAFQLRVDSTPVALRVVTYSLPAPVRKIPTQKIHMATSAALPALPLLSRADWLDAAIELPSERRDQLWKSEYNTVKKIIIHHTATSVRDVNGDGIVNETDYREAVRGIYSYHTYSQKWGDIGYNYIIDPLGRIWEGRHGGDGVVAGHAFRSKQCTKFSSNNISLNDGSVGIALLGTLSSDTPSFQARDSLVNLIAQVSWNFDINPSGSGFFIDGAYPNVVAHRDLDCTECPGNAFYVDMPLIVRDATTVYATLNQDIPHRYAAEKISISPARVEMKKGDSVEVQVMYWNTGTTTWREYGEEPLALASSNIKEHLVSLEALHLASIDANESIKMPPLQTFTEGKLTTPNVAPRHIGTFVFKLADPPDELISRQVFTLALGQKGWIPSSDASVEVVNTGMEWAALRTEGDLAPIITDEPGRRVTIHFTNKGTRTWKRGEVVLSVQGKEGGTPELKDRTWKKKDGQFTFEEKEVLPGEQATFTFLVSAPRIGVFQESVALFTGSKKISGSDYAPLEIAVQPTYETEIVSMKFAPAAFVKGNIQATLTIKNSGTREWKKGVVSAVSPNGKSTSPFRNAKWKSASVVQAMKTIKSGQTLTLTIPLSMPAKPGLYRHTLSFANGTQKIYLKSDEGYKDSIDQEIRVDPLPAKKVVKRK